MQPRAAEQGSGAGARILYAKQHIGGNLERTLGERLEQLFGELLHEARSIIAVLIRDSTEKAWWVTGRER